MITERKKKITHTHTHTVIMATSTSLNTHTSVGARTQSHWLSSLGKEMGFQRSSERLNGVLNFLHFFVCKNFLKINLKKVTNSKAQQAHNYNTCYTQGQNHKSSQHGTVVMCGLALLWFSFPFLFSFFNTHSTVPLRKMIFSMEMETSTQSSA